MATGIENYPNISASDSNYPDGNIKDKTVSLPGTPVNKLVYADMHQTLAKILREAHITANGLPDSEYNGYQYYTAMQYLFSNQKRIQFNSASMSGILVDSDYSPLVIITRNAGVGNFTTMQEPTGTYIGRVMIANYSPYSSDVFNILNENINSSPPPYVVSSGDCVELEYTGSAWNVIQKFKLNV